MPPAPGPAGRRAAPGQLAAQPRRIRSAGAPPAGAVDGPVAGRGDRPCPDLLLTLKGDQPTDHRHRRLDVRPPAPPPEATAAPPAAARATAPRTPAHRHPARPPTPPQLMARSSRHRRGGRPHLDRARLWRQHRFAGRLPTLEPRLRVRAAGAAHDRQRRRRSGRGRIPRPDRRHRLQRCRGPHRRRPAQPSCGGSVTTRNGPEATAPHHQDQAVVDGRGSSSQHLG
jgi:hypothetical protein